MFEPCSIGSEVGDLSLCFRSFQLPARCNWIQVHLCSRRRVRVRLLRQDRVWSLLCSHSLRNLFFSHARTHSKVLWTPRTPPPPFFLHLPNCPFLLLFFFFFPASHPPLPLTISPSGSFSDSPQWYKTDRQNICPAHEESFSNTNMLPNSCAPGTEKHTQEHQVRRNFP